MKEGLVSVIIPVYKAERTLVRCIDSVLAQSYSFFELLLIDDGSPDGSGMICDQYAEKDSRVRVFHKSNGGVSSARNLGLEEAVGYWITFCDADDWLKKDYLKNLLTHATDRDLVVGGFETFGDSVGEEQYESVLVRPSKNVERLKLYMQSTGMKVVWSKLLLRSIICNNEIRFNLQQKVGEDTAFIWSYIAHCQSIQFIDSKDYQYFIDGNFINKYSLSYDQLNEHFDSLRRIVELIEDNWLSRFIVLTLFSKQLYYGLFLKNILMNASLSDYLSQRCLFVQHYGKEYSLKISFIGGLGWNLFLKNRLSASALYYLIRVKYLINKK